ncbi:MAG: crossover junction endodeoxyribonuclease RuvC [Candidatus Hydrogenedentes bacterium]|nr:crossover junction endodeoxyribonuclease RuvC [Candidatus Hydrogenedentota bacterium]
MIAIGIDPGTATTGFGVVKEYNSRLYHITHGIIKTSPNDPIQQRLLDIYTQLLECFSKYSPDLMAIEKIYFKQNVTNGIYVAQARGVALLLCAQRGIPVVEFSPTEVKTALVGYGRAEKHQVQSMVQRLLTLSVLPKPDDAGDALALAICALQTKRQVDIS